MVVNELESLEASIYARDHNQEMFVRQLISIYHANRMLDYLSEHTHQKFKMFEYPEWPFGSKNNT